MKSFPVMPVLGTYRSLFRQTNLRFVALVIGLALNLLLNSIILPMPLYAAGDGHVGARQTTSHPPVSVSVVAPNTVMQIVTEQKDDLLNDTDGSSNEGDQKGNGEEPGDKSDKCPGKPGDDGKRLESHQISTIRIHASRIGTSFIQALGPLGFDPQGGRFCG